MRYFINLPRVESLENGKYKLLEDLIYYSKELGYIIVPAGFVTDFDSVPRLPLVYLLFGGLGEREAILHDWLYSGEHRTIQGYGKIVTREEADKLLRVARYECDKVDLSEFNSVSISAVCINIWAYVAAWLWWIGVRVGGASHWA